MKISERCKKQIEDMERLANELKITDKFEPYQVVAWDRDFESISELYIAYKFLDEENETLTADFEQSEDRCATLEAENKRLKDQVTQLRTIKKSFDVLRALYLGDYENDEPF